MGPWNTSIKGQRVSNLQGARENVHTQAKGFIAALRGFETASDLVTDADLDEYNEDHKVKREKVKVAIAALGPADVVEAKINALVADSEAD